MYLYKISSLVNQDSRPEDVCDNNTGRCTFDVPTSINGLNSGIPKPLSSVCSVEITLFIIITDVIIIITITTNSTTFITISIILKRWNHVCTIPYKV